MAKLQCIMWFKLRFCFCHRLIVKYFQRCPLAQPGSPWRLQKFLPFGQKGVIIFPLKLIFVGQIKITGTHQILLNFIPFTLIHVICNITDTCKEVICLIEDLNLNRIIVIDDLKDGHHIYCGTQKTVNTQGAKKVIFTACHSGKLKLAFTSPNVISTRPKIFR